MRMPRHEGSFCPIKKQEQEFNVPIHEVRFFNKNLRNQIVTHIFVTT